VGADPRAAYRASTGEVLLVVVAMVVVVVLLLLLNPFCSTSC